MKTGSPFPKRKPQKPKDFVRQGVGATPSFAKLLIVCEGQKTEPYYFKALRAVYYDQLKEIDIRSGGSAPITNVEAAERLYREDLASVDGDRSLGFEAVYCVFDRDTHPSFDEAMTKIDALKTKLPIHAIVSYPCFEFWLILHFGFSRSPFAKTSKKSVGDMVKKKLRDFPGFEGYEESEPNAYALTKEKLRDGIKHSKQALIEARDVSQPNPSTHMHELVERLLNIVRNSLLAAWKKQKLTARPADLLLSEINAVEGILGIGKTT